MNLFDRVEPKLLDLTDLGEPKSYLVTESQGTIFFERGCVVTTPTQFFALQRALVRVKGI